MNVVDAPAGWEACYFWDDGTRSYRVSVRQLGATWWKSVDLIGHAHTQQAELVERSTAIAAKWINMQTAT